MPIRALILLALSTLLLAACGPGNTIRLVDPAPAQGVMPSPNAPSVAVVAFADKRADSSAIGERRDKSAFTTSDDAARWVSMAVAEELRAAGYQVSYALSFDQAQHAVPDYIVQGSLLKAWLEEESMTSINTTLSAKYSLANKQKVILRETVNANQTHGGVPSNTATEELLTNTVQDLAKTMTQKISATIGTKKK